MRASASIIFGQFHMKQGHFAGCYFLFYFSYVGNRSQLSRIRKKLRPDQEKSKGASQGCEAACCIGISQLHALKGKQVYSGTPGLLWNN